MIAKAQRKKSGQCRLAFSLIEVMTSMVVVGIAATALYAGMAHCTSATKNARQNLRATQVIVEKMEVIRLLTWDQLTTNNVLPTTFTEAYATIIEAHKKKTNVFDGGLTYYGTITILPPLETQLLGTYTNDLRIVQVQVAWTNQGMPHSRKVTSYVSRYGIQNYILN
jgi:prepilin-type N-terminal cleavage/methylation domain-containing protein